MPYNNDLHDRFVTVDEVTGRGFKARVLIVKDNKYCYDKMRVEMTDGMRFFPSQCHVCLLSNPSFFETVTQESKEGLTLSQGGKKEEKVQLLLSQGSFITINCVMTPADIQIDLPSSGDHLACAEVSYTKDSFVSLMKGFLPQRFFKPKSTYFILYFDCYNGLIYEVTVETHISL